MNFPVQTILPDLEKEDDEILKIECGWRQSVILTKNNKIYITDPILKSIPKINPEIIVNQSKGEEKSKKKQPSVKSEDKIKQVKNDKEKNVEEIPLRWIDISQNIKNLK